MWSALDWVIDKDRCKVEIDPKYADDITFIRSKDAKINQVVRLVPPMLADEGLYMSIIQRQNDTMLEKIVETFGNSASTSVPYLEQKQISKEEWYWLTTATRPMKIY